MSSTHSSARSRESFGSPRTDGPGRPVEFERRYGKPGTTITAREREVLEHVAAGLTNAQVGAKLFISDETVKSHVRHALAKLDARTRTHAVAIAFKAGIIDLRYVDLPDAAVIAAQRTQRQRAKLLQDHERRMAAEAVAAEIRQAGVEGEAREEGSRFRRFLARMWRRPT